MDLHDKHLVRKRLTRLRDIRTNATPSDFTSYFHGAVELEMFRIGSSVSASRLCLKRVVALKQSTVVRKYSGEWWLSISTEGRHPGL
jgi:hypothetical protein